MTFTTNPYCQLADVKTFMNRTDTTQDSFIDELIPQAQQDIDSELGYSFQTDGTTPSPATRIYTGTGQKRMLIDRCQSIVQVLEQPYSIVIGAFGIIQNQPDMPLDITADVALGPDPNFASIPNGFGFMLERFSGFPFYEGIRNYTVKGVFGIASVPTDITRACILLTIHYFKLRDVGYAQTVASAGPKGYPTKVRRDWPDDVCRLVGRYLRPNFFTTGR